MSRFSIAMLAYAALAILAVTTLDQPVPLAGRQVPLSVLTLVILGMFAFRTWLHHKRELVAKLEAPGGRELGSFGEEGASRDPRGSEGVHG